MVQWKALIGKSLRLLLLYEISGTVHLALVGSVAGRVLGWLADENFAIDQIRLFISR